MKDAELSVVTRRYRAAVDPEPWPGADIKDGALIVDIVDKSGHMEGAANGGSIFDGLTRTVREIVGDMIEDTETELLGEPSWPSQFYSDMLGRRRVSRLLTSRGTGVWRRSSRRRRRAG